MTTPITSTPPTPTRISYLDSSVFLALFKNETIPAAGGVARVDIARRIINDADAGRIRAVTSVITIAEVRYIGIGRTRPADAELRLINRLLQRQSLVRAGIDTSVALMAQRLGREYSLSPPDAMHLATAIRHNCVELLVWDEAFVRRVNRRPVSGLWVGEPY